MVVLDAADLDKIEAKLTARAAEEAPEDDYDAHAEAAAAFSAIPAVEAPSETPLAEHPAVKRRTLEMSYARETLFGIYLRNIDDVLRAYQRRVIAAVRLGRPVPSPTVVGEEVAELAESLASSKEAR